MEITRTALEQAKSLLVDAVRVRPIDLADDDLCEATVLVESVGRLVDTMRVSLAAEIEARSAYGFGKDGLAQSNGHLKGAHFVEYLTRVSQAEAGRRVRIGSAIRPSTHLDGAPASADFPAVADAMTAGEIGVDAAAQIIRCLGDAAKVADPAAVGLAEQALVATAATESADLVRQHACVWRETLDPDGAEPRDERIHRRRSFVLGRERGGLSTATWTMDGPARATLIAMFSEACGPRVVPRFLSDEDRARGTTTATGEVIDLMEDPRTREQKQYDVLVGTLTAGLRTVGADPAGVRGGEMRSTATVMAVIQLKDLLAGTGVGWLDGVDEPVSWKRIRMMVCDTGYETVILGDHGEILHHGTRIEMFTTAQRRALAVRDGGCVWPGCQAPPAHAEAHHVIERNRDGPTDIDNGCLLCSGHHHLLHSSAYELAMITGRPHLLAPVWIDPSQTWVPLGNCRATMAA